MVPVENRKNWIWFIKTLLKDIGGLGTSKWTFVTDRQKGLVETLKELVPDSEHCFCVKHMYENIKKKFRSPEFKKLFWQAAYTANKVNFEDYMEKIEKYDPKVDDKVETAVWWLRKIPLEHWCRTYLSCHSKTDSIANNICESFNSYILEGRDKPIITMWELIRRKPMARIQDKLEGMKKYTGIICPNIQKKLNKQFGRQRDYFARLSHENNYEVDQYLETYLVDLTNMTCTCGMFQLTGHPCCHAFAAIWGKRVNVEDYVHDYYKNDTYVRIYENTIHGVPRQRHYISTNHVPFVSPKLKKVKRRPAKMRRNGANEL